ncbi:unnamed protein product, partial [Trichobilharzia regenti]
MACRQSAPLTHRLSLADLESTEHHHNHILDQKPPCNNAVNQRQRVRSSSLRPSVKNLILNLGDMTSGINLSRKNSLFKSESTSKRINDFTTTRTTTPPPPSSGQNNLLLSSPSSTVERNDETTATTTSVTT